MEYENAKLIASGLVCLGAGLIFLTSAYFQVNGAVQSSCVAIITAVVTGTLGIKLGKATK